MDRELVTVGEIEVVYAVSGRVTGHRVALRHNGLREHRLLRAPVAHVLQSMVDAQLAAWDQKWRHVSLRAWDQKWRHFSAEFPAPDSKAAAAFYSIASDKHLADTLTTEATAAVEQAKTLLVQALSRNVGIPWRNWRTPTHSDLSADPVIRKRYLGKMGSP
jgi:hypothetical protein